MKNLKLTLVRRDATTLIYICVAQLFFHSVNNGLIDLLKYVFLAGSLIMTGFLLYNMHAKRGLKRLTFKVLVFLLSYNFALLLISLIVGGIQGGIINIILGIALMSVFIEIGD